MENPSQIWISRVKFAELLILKLLWTTFGHNISIGAKLWPPDPDVLLYTHTYHCIARMCLKRKLINPPDPSKPYCVASTPKRQHRDFSQSLNPSEALHLENLERSWKDSYFCDGTWAHKKMKTNICALKPLSGKRSELWRSGGNQLRYNEHGYD